MKKPLKITLIVLASIIGLLLLIEWIGSPIAKHVVQNHSEQWIGRKVSIGSLHVCPFIGSVRIKNLSCTDELLPPDSVAANPVGEFVRFDELYVRISLLRLIGKDVYLRKIHLTNFDINIWSDNNRFNFSDIPQRFSSSDTIQQEEPDTVPSRWTVDLNDIRLKGGHIAYADRRKNHQWDIENVNLTVPGLHFGNRQSDAGLSLDLPDNGGNLRLRGAYNMASNMYSLILDLTDIDLQQAEPLLKEYFNFHSLRALLSGHLLASGSLDDIMGVRVQGNADLHNVLLKDEDRDEVLSLNSLAVHINQVSPGPKVFNFDSITVDSLHLNFLRTKNYTTLSRLLDVPQDTAAAVADTIAKTNDAQPQQATATATAANSGKQPLVKVGKFQVKNTSVHYVDKTLFSRFTYDIRSINAKADNLTLNGDNHVLLRGQLPNGGSFLANFRGGIDFRHSTSRIVAILKNVQLKDLSPWVEYMFAYPVKSGTLSVTSDNTIRRGELDATEKIEIYDFKLGKKNNRLDAEMKSVPLKAGIDLMTDVNGKINMDIPITGDLSSPKFSLGKIIGRAIGNALLKATAAPFVAIAQAANKDVGDLTQILIEPLQPDFSLEQYKKLDAIAGMMNEHEELSLTLYQQFNLNDAVNEQAVFNLKKEYYLSERTDLPEGPLTLVDIDKIRAIKDNNSAFNAFIEPKVGKKGNLTKRAVNYYTTDSLQAQVLQQAERRNRFVLRYMTEQQHVDKKRLQAITAPQEELNTYKGKQRYEVRGEQEE